MTIQKIMFIVLQVYIISPRKKTAEKYDNVLHKILIKNKDVSVTIKHNLQFEIHKDKKLFIYFHEYYTKIELYEKYMEVTNLESWQISENKTFQNIKKKFNQNPNFKLDNEKIEIFDFSDWIFESYSSGMYVDELHLIWISKKEGFKFVLYLKYIPDNLKRSLEIIIGRPSFDKIYKEYIETKTAPKVRWI